MLIIPISRFRRELKKWMKRLEKFPDVTLKISRNNVIIGVMISPEKFDKLKREEK